MVEPTLQTLGIGLASAAKILQTLKDLVRGDAKAQVAALYDVILSAQTSALEANIKQSSMIERIRELEEELTRIKAWEETKQRYQLHEPSPGTFVYALKELHKGAEPPHWICTNCYEDGKPSILQLKTAGVINDHYLCPHCKTEFKVKGSRPPPNTTINRGPGGPQSWMT